MSEYQVNVGGVRNSQLGHILKCPKRCYIVSHTCVNVPLRH